MGTYARCGSPSDEVLLRALDDIPGRCPTTPRIPQILELGNLKSRETPEIFGIHRLSGKGSDFEGGDGTALRNCLNRVFTYRLSFLILTTTLLPGRSLVPFKDDPLLPLKKLVLAKP